QAQLPTAPRAPTTRAQNSRSRSHFRPCHEARSKNQLSFLLQSTRKAKTPQLPAPRRQKDHSLREFFQSAKSSRRRITPLGASSCSAISGKASAKFPRA